MQNISKLNYLSSFLEEMVTVENKLNLSVEFFEPAQGHHLDLMMVPLEFKEHMQSVIGRRYYEEWATNDIRDFTLPETKKAYLKYVRQLSCVFDLNATTADIALQKEIKKIIALAELQINRSKNITELSLLMIATLGNLYFSVLGGMKYTMKDKVNRHDLKLNAYRSVYYSQTIQQKSCQIFDSLREHFMGDDSKENLEELKSNYKKMPSEEFIRWAYVNYSLVLSEF